MKRRSARQGLGPLPSLGRGVAPCSRHSRDFFHPFSFRNAPETVARQDGFSEGNRRAGEAPGEEAGAVELIVVLVLLIGLGLLGAAFGADSGDGDDWVRHRAI